MARNRRVTPEDYNKKQIDEGQTGWDMVTKAVRLLQRKFGITVDGKLGPETRGFIRHHSRVAANGGIEYWPLPLLSDGRKPRITSAFRTSHRPRHDGVDLFYEYLDSDPYMKPGDGGAVVKRGDRRWFIPVGTRAQSVGEGIVTKVGRISTGVRVWIDHGHDIRSGYFHLKDSPLVEGQAVRAGAIVGTVGDNPRGHDAIHLHFELSPVNKYAPINPEPFLERALHAPF